MSRTEDRLADALAAAARAVPERTLRPLASPPARSRRTPWLAPAAAALAIALVVGLVFAAGMLLVRSHPSGPPVGSQRPVPRYYVVEGLQGGRPVIRATATGKVTGRVPVPRSANLGLDDLVASARGGQYFVAAAAPGIQGERLYRFRLTSTGRVTSFAALPGGSLGNRNWTADAIAASPDGSRVAVALSWAGPVCGSGRGVPACPHFSTRPSYIDIIDVATGTRGVWRGGTSNAFTVASLSWTAHDRQLVYLGQSCAHFQPNSEVCAAGVRTAQVRALDPAIRGGRLDSGPVLLNQSARLPVHRPGPDQPGWRDDHRSGTDRQEDHVAWPQRPAASQPVRDPGIKNLRATTTGALPAVPGPDHQDEHRPRRSCSSARTARASTGCSVAVSAAACTVREPSTAGCVTGCWCRWPPVSGREADEAW